jgi:hypothetical protein
MANAWLASSVTTDILLTVGLSWTLKQVTQATFGRMSADTKFSEEGQVRGDEPYPRSRHSLCVVALSQERNELTAFQ